MSDVFRITLAQLNPTVGDLAGNAAKAREVWQTAKAEGSDLVALPEMFITGYNAQDLIRKSAFTNAAIAEIKALAEACADGPALAIGGPWVEEDALFNGYFILMNGQIRSVIQKHHLPNDLVFDEVRIFDSGPIGGPYSVGPTRIGSPICEDAWYEDVVETHAETGAEFLLIPNGSPYHRTKHDQRLNLMVSRVIESDLPLIYLNMVGGQDDQVFDGSSFVLNRGGALALRLPVFEETVQQITLTRGDDGWTVEDGPKAPVPKPMELDYHAMVLSLRDYCHKTGFENVLLGLSGGIDSALVAVIAADALGADHLRAVMLPSAYTSDGSLDDAKALAQTLGCRYDTLPITEGQAAINNTLEPLFDGLKPDLTEENIQSRLRGLLLMALSNKFGEMLLTTGNKSEVAVGYATIYGDMAGGYNPIKDLYKTRVFDICRWRNENHRDWMQGPAGAVIPTSIIEKPPSAELRPDQKDSDSLPDYPVLDGILQILVDQDGSIADCIAAGYSKEDAKRVEHLLYISEYKRFQAAPGARLSPRAFWLDRRYPIVNRWRDTT
ncbi:MAG: NAD+ synthase [Marinovum sp.]|jgi:NAD+ synthase|nr:NAD+ synthase [Marinovum sp.]MBT6507583.1 NAD+ synthase [Marinovum sp.]